MRRFGSIGGRDIAEVTLTSDHAEAKIIEYGATVRDLVVRRADGHRQRVVLGLETLDDYVAHSPHFGAIAGRYANRIRAGRFVLDGTAHQLVLNQDGRHHLHGGGPTGFGKQPWTLTHRDDVSATFVHVSPEGANGYPGTVIASCRYSLAGATLAIDLTATSDRATVINLCHHSYFNLAGSADILEHQLEVRSNLMMPVDEDQIPNGALVAVAGTPFDFRRPRPVRLHGADGSRVHYDHNFVLRRDRIEGGRADGFALAQAATFTAPDASLAVEVWTSEPCLQVYDGYKLALPVAGHGGVRYGANAGLCLEPQHAPDSPNLPHLPSTTLRPGAVYRQRTEYRFR